MNPTLWEVIAIGGSFIFMIALAVYCVLVAIEKEFGSTAMARTLDDFAAKAVEAERARIEKEIASIPSAEGYGVPLVILREIFLVVRGNKQGNRATTTKEQP